MQQCPTTMMNDEMVIPVMETEFVIGKKISHLCFSIMQLRMQGCTPVTSQVSLNSQRLNYELAKVCVERTTILWEHT